MNIRCLDHASCVTHYAVEIIQHLHMETASETNTLLQRCGIVMCQHPNVLDAV